MPKPKSKKKTKSRKAKASTKTLKKKTTGKAKPAAAVTEEQLIQNLAKKFCKPLPEKELTKLSKSLQDEFGLEDIAQLDSEELWKAVENSDQYLVIEKASDLHKKGASVVLKMYNWITSSEENFQEHMPTVLARANMKITAKFDPLIATYRSVVKTKDRRAGSTGAQAIRWAVHNKQTPDTILEFPGGVDSWAREWQKLGRNDQAPGGEVKPKTDTAAEGLAELRSNLKNGDKALLMVKMKGSKLVSEGYRKLPKRNGKYWPLIETAITMKKSVKSKAAKN